MASYCTVADVKEILQLDPEDSTMDLEIEQCIKSASTHVYNLATKEGITISESIPQSVTDATAHFAAWILRRRRDPSGAEAFKAEAEEIWQKYADAERGIPFKVGHA